MKQFYHILLIHGVSVGVVSLILKYVEIVEEIIQDHPYICRIKDKRWWRPARNPARPYVHM